MDDAKIVILLLTVLLVLLATWFMRGFTNASKLHLYIFSGLWFVLLVTIPFAGWEYYITVKTYSVFCISWLLLYIGTFIAYPFFYRSSAGNVLTSDTYNFRTLRLGLFFVFFLSVVSNYIHYTSLFSKFNNVVELALLRTDEGHDAIDETSGVFFNTFGRIYNIYLPIAFLLYKKGKLHILILIAMILFAFASAAASLTRYPVLFVFIITLVSIVLLRIKINKYVLIAGPAFFIALLYFSTKEIGKLGGSDNFNFGEVVAYYFLGGIKAYQSLMNGHYHAEMVYDNPYYSIDFINYFSKKLGFVKSYPPIIRTYSDTVFTNVYTYLDAFTLDFGMLGMFFFPLLVGFVSGFFSCMVRASQMLLILLCTLTVALGWPCRL